MRRLNAGGDLIHTNGNAAQPEFILRRCEQPSAAEGTQLQRDAMKGGRTGPKAGAVSKLIPTASRIKTLLLL